MQNNGRARTPPLSHFPIPGQAQTQPRNSYGSSSEDSYNRMLTHSRSASGTSETHYDEMLGTPPPKSLIKEYSRTELVMGDVDRASGEALQSPPIRFRQSDSMGMHLLLETALTDSQHFHILSPDELEELKKEETRLLRQIEAGRRKLFFETRVHNTTQSLQRLESKKGRSTSPDAARRSGQPFTDSNGVEHDPAARSKKCEELAHELWKLERRKAELQDQRLKHTAGVLQLNHQIQSSNGGPSSGFAPKTPDLEPEDEANFNFAASLIDVPDIPQQLPQRLETLSTAVYDIINGPGHQGAMELNQAAPPGTGAEDELRYIEEGLKTVKGLHEELLILMSESNERGRSIDNTAQQTNAMLAGLWDELGSTVDEVKQTQRTMQASADPHQNDTDTDDEDDYQDEQEQNYSIKAFSGKVQRLCARASAMSEQWHREREANTVTESARQAERTGLVEQLQELHDKNVAGQRALDNAKAQMMEAKSQADQNRKEMEYVSAEKDARVETLEAELVRLQTEVTVARAELDGAYGTRAQRAAESAANSGLKQELQEAEQRISVLQKELGELINEYETMVKQSVEAEKERESLETLVDKLQERTEQAEVKLSEEKVRLMARRASTLPNGDSGREVAPKKSEQTSIGTMREEFKKMMREARAEHFRTLRAEQEARRKLEATVRALRKEQGSTTATAAAAAANGSPSIPTAPSAGKSGLSNSVTA